MNREKAIEILGEPAVRSSATAEWFDLGPDQAARAIFFHAGREEITLDGDFTAEQLKALAWWMEKYGQDK